MEYNNIHQLNLQRFERLHKTVCCPLCDYKFGVKGCVMLYDEFGEEAYVLQRTVIRLYFSHETQCTNKHFVRDLGINLREFEDILVELGVDDIDSKIKELQANLDRVSLPYILKEF